MKTLRCTKCGFEIKEKGDKALHKNRCPYCGAPAAMSEKKHVMNDLGFSTL